MKTNKSYNTLFGVALGILVALYIMLLFKSTNQTAKYNKFEHTIDSINLAAKKLKTEQDAKDSLIEVYDNQLQSLNKELAIERKKLITYKQTHHEKILIAIKYTNAELDSFFTNRYK
jgi:uncharacterized membrane protein YgaE (UPF0421/DUF939 family)